MRVADVRAQNGATVPAGFEALGLDALATRLGVSRMTAWRRMQQAAATQRDPEVLRVVRLLVPTGKGALRLALHVLWPLSEGAPVPDVALAA